MKRKNIKDIIKNHFFDNPSDKLRVREIEKILKIPLPSVIRYCKELEKENLLRINQIGNSVFYTADRISEKYILEKKLNNIRILYESEIINYLKKELSNPLIILFGSFAKGEDIEKSDIDIYIETLSNKKLNLDKFKKLLKREIHLFIYKNINSISNIHLSNNIINGIILNNYIEIFK